MENKTDYIKDAELKIVAVELKLFNGSEDIEKVSFETNKGLLTWKPKLERSTMEKGVKIKEMSSMTKVEFMALKKTTELLNEINMNGSANVKISYGTMEAEKDGQVVTYRFLRFLSQYDDMEVLKETEIRA